MAKRQIDSSKLAQLYCVSRATSNNSFSTWHSTSTQSWQQEVHSNSSRLAFSSVSAQIVQQANRIKQSTDRQTDWLSEALVVGKCQAEMSVSVVQMPKLSAPKTRSVRQMWTRSSLINEKRHKILRAQRQKFAVFRFSLFEHLAQFLAAVSGLALP